MENLQGEMEVLLEKIFTILCFCNAKDNIQYQLIKINMTCVYIKVRVKRK